MTTKSVVVLDYGSGNLRSAQRALERVGADVEVTADRSAALAADGLVVPGVGAFEACMVGLRGIGGDAIIADDDGVVRVSGPLQGNLSVSVAGIDAAGNVEAAPTILYVVVVTVPPVTVSCNCSAAILRTSRSLRGLQNSRCRRPSSG